MSDFSVVQVVPALIVPVAVFPHNALITFILTFDLFPLVNVTQTTGIVRCMQRIAPILFFFLLHWDLLPARIGSCSSVERKHLNSQHRRTCTATNTYALHPSVIS